MLLFELTINASVIRIWRSIGFCTFSLFLIIQLVLSDENGIVTRYGRQLIIGHYELILFHFNRKLLVTTLTLLNAIAAPAIIGFKRKPLMG